MGIGNSTVVPSREVAAAVATPRAPEAERRASTARQLHSDVTTRAWVRKREWGWAWQAVVAYFAGAEA
ncbi:hypothetical protein GCM10009864_46910 [Streptomyces lunalinharesii]|uniref:Uncharacterized protein n=1 Tax=Streptomyces lunalinharesii TaxID=333384 RepID=A0ABP6EP46_9ACTN